MTLNVLLLLCANCAVCIDLSAVCIGLPTLCSHWCQVSYTLIQFLIGLTTAVELVRATNCACVSVAIRSNTNIISCYACIHPKISIHVNNKIPQKLIIKVIKPL